MRLVPKDQDWTVYAWLVYLLFFLLAGWTSHLPSTAAATAVALVLYFWSFWIRGARVLWIVAAWFALGLMFVRVNPAASVFFVYAACLYGKVWEPPVAFRFLAGHLVLVSLLCWAVGCDVYVWISSVVFSGMVGSVVVQYAQRQRLSGRLAAAHAQAEHLAKVAERERIARDLHDLLGHTLSLIVLKSELASRLSATQPERAAEEIRDVERISRDALAQVRAAVRGYRSVGFESELRQAREAAGDGRHRGGSAGGTAPALRHAGERLRHGAARGRHQYRAARSRHHLPPFPASERPLLRVGDCRQRPRRRARRRQRIERDARACGGPGRHSGARWLERHFAADSGAGMSIRVVIAEDQAMVRGALAALLAIEGDIEIAGQAQNGREALDLIAKLAPDIVLTDIEMPELTGLELAAELKRRRLPVRVVILTTFARAGYLRRALDAGVSGYLLKDAPAATLANAIRRIRAGGRVIDPELAAEAWTEADPLTDRERQVLRYAGEGAGGAEIAERLSLSEGTVRNYLSEAISKLGASNRTEAARIARQKGWL